MRNFSIIVSTLVLLLLMAVSTSANAASFTGTTDPTDPGLLSFASGTYTFSIDGSYSGTSGTLNSGGNGLNGTFTNATLEFDVNGSPSPTIFSGVTGTYSNTATATAAGLFTASFTDGKTVFNLSGASSYVYDDGAGNSSYTLSNVTGQTKPVPEAGTVVSFGCMLALGGLLICGSKRRQVIMNA